MANFVAGQRDTLQLRHYLLLANQTDHWFNAYPNRVSAYRADYGDDFCLVLWRDTAKDDAYVLPYGAIKHLLVASNLDTAGKGSPRWIGRVQRDVLKIGKSKGLSVETYHNAFDLLEGELDPKPMGGPADADPVEVSLGLERDLQKALRQNIAQLETGLAIVDDGSEQSTEAGRIDITARDAQGMSVVIELKAGTAAPAALTQLLAYMGALADTEKRQVRGLLVAAGFHPKVLMAAKAVPDVQLRRYSVSFRFDPPA
jgi:hypothetical protein